MLLARNPGEEYCIIPKMDENYSNDMINIKVLSIPNQTVRLELGYNPNKYGARFLGSNTGSEKEPELGPNQSIEFFLKDSPEQSCADVVVIALSNSKARLASSYDPNRFLIHKRERIDPARLKTELGLE
jgi:hypothetical protein